MIAVNAGTAGMTVNQNTTSGNGHRVMRRWERSNPFERGAKHSQKTYRENKLIYLLSNIY